MNNGIIINISVKKFILNMKVLKFKDFMKKYNLKIIQ